jgi:hypothetical protein
MARKLKTDLWKKAYLIEFVDETGVLLDAFTFSVPPESEEITYSQRKSETKTFGGLHVDDYGLDAVKISLSGSTINQDLKKIYNPKSPGADKWMTGEQEIYYLRNLIQKYKGDNRAKETRIMLYDLSKMNYIKGQASDGTEGGVIKNYWRVFPGDFKIRRASDRPFTYKYSIEFTAVDFEDSENMKNILAPKFGFARAALDFLKKGVAWFEKGLKYANKINALLEDVNSSIRDVTEILDAYADVLMGYVDGAINTHDTAHDIIKIPGDASVKVLNIGLEYMNAGKRLLKSVEAVTITVLSYGTLESIAPQEVLDEYDMTATEFRDACTEFCANIEDAANVIVADSKSSNLPTATMGATPDASAGTGTGSGTAGTGGSGSGGSEGGGSGGGGSEDDSSIEGTGGGEAGSQATQRYSIVLSYGDFAVTLKATDSLESLASEYCGSPDRAIDIAVYNGVASIDELNPGDAIKIPILAPSSRHSRNRTYSRPEDRDNYGRDIYLDKDGCTAASTSGDYLLTEGVENLNQAILLRLRESVNRRIRLVAYGIRTNISDPAAGKAYIISSIDLTVSRDPRVSAVDNIKFAGTGDGLDITVEYTDINHNNGSTVGRA